MNDIDVNMHAKNKLAKLLAKENLVVKFDKVQTAMFDVKARVLILPILSNMTVHMLDRFIGHEVAHALFTPADELVALAKEADTDSEKLILMSFINIVEDIRIEKHIISMFNGLRYDFNKSCEDFINSDFFNIKHKDINSLDFADKVNLFFKINVYNKLLDKLNFVDKDELDMISRLAQVMTWQDTYKMSVELMNFCKKKNPETFKNIKTSIDELKKLIEDIKNGDNKKGLSQEKINEIMSNPLNQQILDIIKENLIKTQSEYDKNIANNIDKKNNRTVTNKEANKLYGNLGGYIINYEKILNEFPLNHHSNFEPSYYKNNIKNYIVSMINEFNRKKSAIIWNTKQTNITGSLDLNKLYRYKFDDEIFKSEIKFNKGKNHTILIFVDFSGSMSATLPYVIRQLYLLIMFTRRVGISCMVYGFTSGKNNIRDKDGTVCSVRLLELYNSNMKDNVFNKMFDNLLCGDEYGGNGGFALNPSLALGSTPLNDTIILSHGILNKVVTENKNSVVSCIFLTDGDSNTLGEYRNNMLVNIVGDNNKNIFSINSRASGKSYSILTGGDNYKTTRNLVNFIKGEYNVNMINFHLFTSDYSFSRYLPRYVNNNVKLDNYINEYTQYKSTIIKNKDVNSWDAVVALDISTFSKNNDIRVKNILTKVTEIIS